MKKSAATAISPLHWLNAARSWPEPSGPPCPATSGPSLIGSGPIALLLLPVDEAGGFHQGDMARLFLRDPVGVLLAFEGGGVERALLHELLPLGRGLHLFQQVDVIGDLVLRDAAGHEDAAQHEVIHL